MKFGPVAVAAAQGAVLGHSVKLPDGALKKGTRLTQQDVQRMAAAGLLQVTVARLDADDVAEDAAAAAMARALRGVGVDASMAATGRVNLHARGAGLLLLDALRIHAANAVHEGLTIATLHGDTPVVDGQMLATVKVIPYAVPAVALQQVVRVLAGDTAALCVAPWRGLRIGLVLTRTVDTPASMLAKMRRAVVNRLGPLGATLVAEQIVGHDEARLAAALATLVQDVAAPQLLLVSGIAATVDRNDVVPAAVVKAGGHVLHAGMPVDPGNLLLLAQLGNGLPVVGIPTCARSPKLNGFDFVLRRFAAGATITAADIKAMGVGGLLTEIETRPMPRDLRQLG